jgi:PAS domain S-box
VHQVELEMQNEELRNSRKELEQLHEKYYDLYNFAPVGYLTLDLNILITEVNDTFANLVGLANDRLIGTRFTWYISSKCSNLFQRYFRKAFKTVEKQSFDIELIPKNGVPFYSHVELLPQIDRDIIQIKTAVVDISQRKKLEDELRRSNEELEQFAYVASHDLQEPLRTISSFTQLLERRYHNKLDEDADEFMEYVVEAAQRMQQMILDLLEYSRVVTKGGFFKDVNTDESLDKALFNLKGTIENTNATVTHDDLPILIGDESQLIKVFQNLISNAIKFKKPEISPKIHISASLDDKRDEYVFSVSDNGIGMDPQYAERIFTIFQRLHTLDEYQGSGIGLSITKRIIERHGGRVWVKSSIGNGSTFYFTIPTSPPR